MKALLLSVFMIGAAVADWPAYNGDASRSAYNAKALELPLQLHWQYSGERPQPAWPTSRRLQFDFAAQPVVSEGRVFIGSSVSGALTALNAASGRVLWTFYTDGPIRFAPSVANGRVYLASDDGALYCLDAETGERHWQQQGGPSTQMCLGNGRLISRWPARGGPVVDDGQVFFAAGIWPSDGVYVYCLDAQTGDIIWTNSSSGGLQMPQPHRGADAESGVAAQGYLAVDAEQLYVPTGRAVPAVFDRKTGRFKYFHLQANRAAGGFSVTLARDTFANGSYLFRRKGGRSAGRAGGVLVADHPEGLISAAGKKLRISPWSSDTALGKAAEFAIPHEPLSMLAAGNMVITGGSASIAICELRKAVRWQQAVDGPVHALAVSDGRLYASSATGSLYCFSSGDAPPAANRPDLTAPAISAKAKTKAAEIVQRCGVRNGYCVDLQPGDGQLAQALATRTDLQVVAVAPNRAAALPLRERMIAAGLYGTRVSVIVADNSLPDYMADLLIGEGEARLLRPWGGQRYANGEIERRGPLEGAGQWTHQYANAANTVCSDDEIVGSSLGMLWYNDLRQTMPQRHGRGPAPLVYKGIIYCEGLNDLIAVDAYNGRKLWQVELPGILKAYDGDHLMGTSGSGSNFCVAETGIYLRRDNHCLRLDRLTGEELARFEVDGKWGYIAIQDGVLLGSVANPEHVVTFRYKRGGDMSGQLTESRSIFALDAITGEQKWSRPARWSLRHNAIAVASDRLLLIDRPAALYDRSRSGKPSPEKQPGKMVALDLHTGEEVWSIDDDIYGTTVAISEGQQSVVMGYQSTRFQLASEIGGRVSVFDLATGEKRWEKSVNYASRLVLNDKTIYAQGAAMDLLSGEPRPFNFSRSYGCGVLASSRDLMVFRSATLGYFDLRANDRVRDFGGIRPGCWINVIPANGLVLAPDASAGCTCSYLNRAWIALQPHRTPKPPEISPASGTFREPPVISLKGTGTLVYTLDGSDPSADSATYEAPFALAESAELRFRAIVGEYLSPIRLAEYVIDDTLLSLNPDDWQVIDSSVAIKGDSKWSSDGGMWRQRGNIFSSTPTTLSQNSAVIRPGTFLAFGGDLPAERSISLRLRSGDNDAMGIAFDFTDASHHTLWAMNAERKYRTVLRQEGETVEELWRHPSGYQPGTWYQLRIEQRADSTRIFLDDQLECELRTSQPASIALYAWGNDDCSFSDLKVVPIP